MSGVVQRLSRALIPTLKAEDTPSNLIHSYRILLRAGYIRPVFHMFTDRELLVEDFTVFFPWVRKSLAKYARSLTKNCKKLIAINFHFRFSNHFTHGKQLDDWKQ